MKKIATTFGAGLLLLSANATGETLQDAFQDAYAFNPNIHARKIDQQIAETQLDIARSARRPQVDATLSATERGTVSDRDFVPGLADGLITSAQIQAVLPVYTGGRIDAGIKQAEANISATEQDLNVTTQSIFLQVVDVYITYLRDLERVRIRKNNVRVLEEQLDAAESRFEVGEVTRTDVAQALARLEGARANLAQAGAAAEASRAIFRETVGRDPGELAPPPPLPDLPETFEEAVEIALDNNPSLLGLYHRETATKEGIRAAEGAYKPQVTIVGSVQRDEGYADYEFEEADTSVTGQVTIPLYTGGQRNADIQSAKLNRERIRYQIDATRNSVVSSVASVWANYQAANESILASERQVAANEIAFEGAEIELEVGLRTTLNLLDQEQELLESRLSLVFAQRDAYVAAYQLLSVMGQLSTENLSVNVPLSKSENYSEESKRRWFWQR